MDHCFLQTLLLWLKYQYCGVLIADCLRRDIKAIGLGYEERSARPWSGLDLGNHLVVVEVLLLVDVNPARRCVRCPVPTPTRYIDALELWVVMHAIHGFRPREILNFLARQAVVNGHLRRSPCADE